MNPRKNAIANYLGQFYVVFIGILILPLYLKYLGAAAFGLVGLFAVMQAWLRILDMGLTPALSRQVAYSRGHQDPEKDFFLLLRSLELIFLVLSIVLSLIIILTSKFIAYHWLKITGDVSYHEVGVCVAIMGIMFGLRWFTDLYNGGIRGAEEQVWLNKINVFIASLQYLGGWAMLHWISHNLILFFLYQLVISLLNLLLVMRKFYKVIALPQGYGLRISWQAIRRILPFASAIAYTSMLWIITTQIDRLLFSHILPLSQYGYFTLVSNVAGGIMYLSTPISMAILPRMTYLLSQQNEQAMLQLYRKATRVTAVIVFSMAGVIAVFPTPLLFVWTGNMPAAIWAGNVLFWYALGNGILSVLAFQYYLQYAYGKLKLHVIFNTIFACITVPFIVLAAYRYGPHGTAVTWFSIQLIIFFIYPPIIHRKYAPGIHLKWLLRDILPTALMSFVVLWFLSKIFIPYLTLSRVKDLAILLGFTLILLTMNVLISRVFKMKWGFVSDHA